MPPRVLRLFESTIPSGNAYKVSLLLSHLGQTVDVVALDIMATPPETRRPDFLRRNPNGRIPVVELEDGSHLAESNAILCYLGESTPFMPADPLARARAMQWMFFEQYSHEPYVAVLKFWTLWGGLHRRRPDEIETWIQRGEHALSVMNQHLATNAWFTGERYGIADIALYAYTHTAGDIGFEMDAVPAVVGWLGRVRDQPGHVAMKPDLTRR